MIKIVIRKHFVERFSYILTKYMKSPDGLGYIEFYLNLIPVVIEEKLRRNYTSIFF